MRRVASVVWVVLAIGPVAAQSTEVLAPPKKTPTKTQPPDGKLLEEVWESAYLSGAHAGYVRYSLAEIPRKDGQVIRRAVKELHLTVKRFTQTAHIQAMTGTDETVDGQILGVFMQQMQAKQQALVLTGRVEGDQLKVSIKGPTELERSLPWSRDVLSIAAEHRLLAHKKAKPGDRFTYQLYEPTVNAVVSIRVEVKDLEEVETVSGKKKLLKAIATPQKIDKVQLPANTLWADPKTLDIVKSQTELPGLGLLELQRTTREKATAPPGAPRIDLGEDQAITVKGKTIAFPSRASSVTYRMTLPKDDEPDTAFKQDARQTVSNADGKTFDLTVKAIRSPRKTTKPVKAARKEFTESNYFINSSDDLVRQHAKQAVGDETDPWKKARRIEAWVHSKMRSLNFTEAMATADHVAKTLEGDCTEYAMLTAAMCRAQGIPSRTAIGLVYVERPRGAQLLYHMWTEVQIQGQWLALDATLGQGSVGPTHLKITDHSWHDTRTFAPLLPVTRVILGKPIVEVVAVTEGR